MHQVCQKLKQNKHATQKETKQAKILDSQKKSKEYAWKSNDKMLTEC